MAPLRCAAKLRPHALHPGAIQGKEGIEFCHLATLRSVVLCARESEDTNANDNGGGGDGKITVNSKDAHATAVDRLQ